MSRSRPAAAPLFGFRSALGAAFVLVTLTSCDLPAGLSTPTTRNLETGAAATLSTATSFEITGSYSDGANHWTIDLQEDRHAGEHVVVTGPTAQLEAVILEKDAYFHGPEFLSAHMGNDPLSRGVVKVSGNSWWRGSAAQAPQLQDLTDGNLLRSAFLGQAVSQRTDHVSFDGVDAVDLSGARADVFIASQPPYQLLRVRLKHGVSVDGIRDADLHYGGYNRAFAIAAPTDVIDFSNLSTLPPIYTVLSVDTTKCGSPCTVSAILKNLGGLAGGQGPSTITFTMTDSASQLPVATCEVPVQPNVGFNATTSVVCTFSDIATPHGNAMSVSAAADNSGHAPSNSPNPTSGPSLTCRIPVVTSTQAGWVTFPDGSFQADPKGNVQLAGYSSPPFFWRSYDKAYERWLPVPRDWISPDGQHYAYADPPAAPGQTPGGGVRVVDMATGADHLFRPAAANWVVLDYEAEGVYLAVQPAGPAAPTGLWLLDPSGRTAFRALDQSHRWQYISGGGAWGTTDPLTGHGPGPGSRLLRLDLQTSAIASWYKRTDIEFLVTGADAAGHPLLQTSKDYSNQLLLVTAQDSVTALQAAPGSVLPHLSNYVHPVSDAHGMWLGDTTGMLSLYTPTGVVEQVGHVGSSDVLVAGGCH